MVFGGIRLGTFMISRPTLSCSYWWKFVYTEYSRDIIRASVANVQRRNVIFLQ